MAAKIVVVGCRLPHGIILHHPVNVDKTVELKGLNKATIIGADYAITEVDGEFWEAWMMFHKDFAPLKSGAIFVAKTVADVAAVAKELTAEMTGFERMNPKGDKRAAGVKTATTKD